MTRKAKRLDEYVAENEKLRSRAEEAEETLRAIRSGEVDAFVMDGPQGHQVYTLDGADRTYRLLVESISEGVFILAPDGAITYANKAISRLLDTPLERMIGSPISQFVSAEDSSMLDAILEQSGGPIGTREARLSKASGGVIYASVSFAPLAADGSQAVSVIVTDLTERREGVRKYREVVENAQEGIWTIDQHADTTFVNPQMARMLGYQVEEMLGKCLFSFVDEGQAENIKANMQRRREGFRGLADCEFIRKDGSRLFASVQAWPIADADGADMGFTAFIADNTERKQLEEQLRQSQKLEAVGTLAGGIAHDFKNILMGISAYAEVLQVKLGEEHPQFDATEQILNCVERGSSLVGQLLTLNKKHEIDVKPTDLNAVVGDSEELLRRLMGEHILVGFDLSSDSLIVNADVGHIQQVLLNLAVNARDAMPTGGKLVVTTRRKIAKDAEPPPALPRQTDYAKLAVSDTGIGMDNHTKERIFEPFFTTKNRSERAGLGLAVAYSIIKQHGGYIDVYSELEKGTSLDIYLPLADTDIGSAHSLSHIPVGRTHTILLVEDEEIVREPVRAALEEWGYTVYCAADGQQAVELYRERQDEIDLSVMDLVMPKVGGVQAAAMIREIRQNAKILFISGHSPESVDHTFVPPDDTPLIRKPFSLFDFEKQMRSIIDSDVQ